MKTLNIFILLIALCACAPKAILENSTEKLRPVPIFLTGETKKVAFKASMRQKNKDINVLLLANKRNDIINIRLIGAFATQMADINLQNGIFTYVQEPSFLDEQALLALEDILLTLFSKPTNLISQSAKMQIYKTGSLKQKYYFKEGQKTPYKLKQKSEGINKTFLFEDYKNGLPNKIDISAKYGLVNLNLENLTNKSN